MYGMNITHVVRPKPMLRWHGEKQLMFWCHIAQFVKLAVIWANVANGLKAYGASKLTRELREVGETTTQL
jgi:hypothetical protein